MRVFVIRRFKDHFVNLAPLFDALSRLVLASQDSPFDRGATEPPGQIQRVLGFIVINEIFNLFMETYAHELSHSLSKKLHSIDSTDADALMRLYRHSIRVEKAFWAHAAPTEDARPALRTVHRFFLVTDHGQGPLVQCRSLMRLRLLGDFGLLCSGFASLSQLDQLEKEVIKSLAATVQNEQKFEFLFEAFLWAHLVGSKRGADNRECTQRIFEGLEVVLDRHFHFFELHIVPALHQQVLPFLASPPEEVHNIFDQFSADQNDRFSQLDMSQVVRLLLAPAHTATRFWFLVQMVHLVSDKSQLFSDFYASYFERRLRGLTRYPLSRV